MTADQIKLVLETLTNALRNTKAAYYRAEPGVTYEDMRDAAARLLEWRGRYEKATGRPVRSKATPKAIATLLRTNV